MKEEIGLTAGSITYLGFVFPSPPYSNEVIHLYLARQLSHGQQNTDSDEFVDIEVYHRRCYKNVPKRGDYGCQNGGCRFQGKGGNINKIPLIIIIGGIVL